MFSKKAMEDELIDFIDAYLQSTQRMFRVDALGDATQHPIFLVCSSVYDFAFMGARSKNPHFQHLGNGGVIDGSVADAEMFLLGQERPNVFMKLFQQEDDVQMPLMAAKTVQAAVARHVLYGGERYTTPEEFEGVADCLSFQDIALLADMDEKSIRNAANPRNKDPLITTVSGKRTWIEPDNALTWLMKRRGFVPSLE